MRPPRRLTLLAPALLLLASPLSSSAQVEARPVLGGMVFVGDAPLTEGTVVLHQLTDETVGELDSVRVGPDGSFSFVLPKAPDPARSDVFFASTRHDGVLYFGPFITMVLQLDSLYEIHAYDTLLAPPEGLPIAVQSRSIFFEPDGSGAWRVTDLFEVRNDRDRTIVARRDGRTWSYPLPKEARNVTAGEGEMSPDVATYEDGALTVRAALPPGQRLFVVRYALDSPFLSIPTPGVTEALDILIREPAPAVEVVGFSLVDRIELEAGSTYRRFSRVDVSQPFVRVIAGKENRPPPVQWIAVILAMILAVSGLVAVRAGGARGAATNGGGRLELLTQVARLDEEFYESDARSNVARRTYDQRRAKLLRRLRSET